MGRRVAAVLCLLLAVPLVSAPAPEPSDPSGPSSPSGVRFTPRAADDGAVKVRVESDPLPTLMEARADGGAWAALRQKQPDRWQGDAVPADGSVVQSRATVPGGLAYDDAGFRWPDAARLPDPEAHPAILVAGLRVDIGAEPDPDTATARVLATFPVEGVAARLNDGPWQEMRRNGDGDWTADVLVLEGWSRMRLQARGGGAVVESGCFLVPDGVATNCERWPVPGSFVAYDISGANPVLQYRGHVRLVHAGGGAWAGECTITYDPYDGTPGQTLAFPMSTRPLRNLLSTRPGEPVAAEAFHECGAFTTTLVTAGDGTQALRGRTTLAAHVQGEAGGIQTLAVRRAEEDAGSSEYQDITESWDLEMGLVTFWHHAHLRSNDRGRLVATDAPMGRVLSPADQAALAGAWPVEGSHVTYAYCEGGCDDVGEDWGWIDLRHHAGDWTATCTSSLDWTPRPVAAVPVVGPAQPAVGDAHSVPVLRGCAPTAADVAYRGTAIAERQDCCPMEPTVHYEAHEASDAAGGAAVVWDVESGLAASWRVDGWTGGLSSSDATFA